MSQVADSAPPAPGVGAPSAVRKMAPRAAPPLPDPAWPWTATVFVLMILISITFNAVMLWPEFSLPAPNVNDDATHYMLIQRASEALADGENPIDHWVPELELGFPWFLYYQHLPHLTVVALHRLFLGHVDLFTLLNAVRFILLISFPLVVYWSMRRMEFSTVAAAVSAFASSLLVTSGLYGFEYGSYVWRGFGMYTQLWAMPLSFVSLACVDRLLRQGRGYVATVLALTVLMLSHLIYAYMMGISTLVLLCVGLSRANALPRIGRLVAVWGLTAVITAYMSVPFILGKAYLSASPYLQRFKYDSYGAASILKWLVNGELMDSGRLPVLTALAALGVAAAILIRSRPAVIALALFTVWLLLYFGRPTWGRLIDVLPLHEGLLLHRFSGSVHLAAILLIGLGGEWLWRLLHPVPERWRALALPLLLLLLTLPAFQERYAYYSLNTFWMQRTLRALDADGDAREILATLKNAPPGRTHAGLRKNWGIDLRFGDVRFWDLLTHNRIVAFSPTYTAATLNADLVWHLEYANPAHYDLLDIRYLVAPRTWAAPDFLKPIKETRRYVLYQAPTSGYAEFATIARTSDPDSQATLFAQNRAWFLGPDPGAGRFVRYDFPPGRSTAAAATVPGTSSGCPGGGSVTDKRVRAGRIDLETDCPAPATLVIKVTYHPNWQVTVDARPVPTFMVSPSFIGVELPAGRHAVSAEYRPRLHRTVLLLAGLAVLVAVVFGGRRLERLDARFSRIGQSRG